MSSPFHLRVDAEAVEAAMQNYVTHPEEGAGELLRFAQLHHVLPLWTDWIGCIALRPTGQVVFFAWDDPEKVEPVGAGGDHDRRMVHAARPEGSRRFPAIAALAPVRAPPARAGASCGGSANRATAPAETF